MAKRNQAYDKKTVNSKSDKRSFKVRAMHEGASSHSQNSNKRGVPNMPDAYRDASNKTLRFPSFIETANSSLKAMAVIGFLTLIFLGAFALLCFYIVVQSLFAKIVIVGGASATIFLKYLFNLIKSNKRKEISRIKKHYAVKIFIPALILSMVLYIIPPTNSYAHDFVYRVSSTIAKGTKNFGVVKDEEDEGSDSTPSAGAYNEKMSFILRGDERSGDITPDLTEYVYAMSIDSDDILLYTAELSGNRLPLATSNYIKDSHIQKLEDAFLHAIEHANEYLEDHERDAIWYQCLPSEQELLNVIQAEEEYANDNGNAFIYNRLSNNYQMLAEEYYKQNKSQGTIKYYYMKSIECDYKCISFVSKSDKKDYYNISMARLYWRYNDILLCCKDELDEEEIERLEALKDNLYQYK